MMKKIIAALLSFVLLFSFTACQDAPIGIGKGGDIEIWSTPNTTKVLLDKAYAATEKTNKEVRFETAKGEYENGQLIVTALGDVAKVYLTESDLTDGKGNKIAKENIDILFEKYINISAMSSPEAKNQFGYWPDALVPMKNLAAKNENYIKKGNNQGFWITIFTPLETVSGTYTGNFTLEYDDRTMMVPISVKVWNFAVPQETHMKTSFHNTRDYIMAGEFDGSEEMYRKYYERLLDYRISTNMLPVFDTTVESFVREAKKYAADPRCGAYNLTNKYINEQVVVDGVINKFIPNIDYQHMEDTLIALANESTPEVNLFKKLYVYDIAIDEPEGTNRIEDANYKQIKHIETLEKTVTALNAAGFDWQGKGITEEDILKVEFVVTGRYIDRMTDIRTYCPLLSDFTTEAQRKLYEDIRADEYKTTWVYDAWGPQFPYPNYRIEESSLGSRVMSWMQKDYDISGLLYWGTSVYCKVITSAIDSAPRDPYVDPYSFDQMKVTADGCLTYPGKPYGVDGPVSSIRLESIRDGMEDYEYLWLLEKLIKEASTKYSANFNYKDIMRSIYDSLYIGVIPNYLEGNFIEARREVASLIELLQSDFNSMVFVDSIDANTNEAKIKVYASAGTSVTINQTTLTGVTSGQGLLFSYTMKMTQNINNAEIILSNGENSITTTKFIGKKSNFIPAFNELGEANLTATRGSNLDPKDHITLVKTNKDSGGVAIDGLSANAMQVNIKKYTSTNEMAEITYSPSLMISKNQAIGALTADQLDGLFFNIYNGNTSNKRVKVYFNYGLDTRMFADVVLKPGMNTISIHQIYIDTWSSLIKTDKISIVFEKADNANDVADIYYVDNIYYTLLG